MNKETLLCLRMQNAHRKIEFALNSLPKIMEDLNVPKWKIGGSVAGYLYGLNFNRIPHDIDVIVPFGTLDFIKMKVEKSIYLQITHNAYYNELPFTKHFVFRTVRGILIDIIEAPKEDEEWNRHVASIYHLYESKKRYHRLKDKKDLELLTSLYNEMYSATVQDNLLGVDAGVDALEELKKKMEEGK